MIVASNICKTYCRGSTSVEALRDVSFEIQAGERVALLGRSGSGKSTLLNILAGLDRATKGQLKIGDVDLSDPSLEILDQYRQSQVGVVFQQFRLIKHKTARQNVALPLILSGASRRVRKERVAECLKLVGLEDRAHHRPTELSGGEQQRIAVARAISHQPKVLLADEPTGNLDSSNAEHIMQLIVDVQRRVQSTFVLITHDEKLAHEYTDRILRLEDGQLRSDEPSGYSTLTDAPQTATPRSLADSIDGGSER